MTSLIATDENDIADEYHFCLVIPAFAEGGLQGGEGPRCISKLRSFGLDLFLFIGLNKKEVFVLIRCPIDLVKKFADKINFPMLLNPDVIEVLAETGDIENNINSFKIPHDPDLVVSYEPYRYIYGRYSTSVADRLYARESLMDHPFTGIRRLKITRLLMESQPPDGGKKIKMRKFIDTGKVLACFPLHDNEKLKDLRKLWANYKILPWNFKPLPLIQDYFGDKIALYFVFTGHLSLWLILPAVLGFIVQLVIFNAGEFSSSQYLPAFAIFIALWAIVMLEFWKRRQSTFDMKWGLSNFEKTEHDRPEFKGELIQSFINGDQMLYFAQRRRSYYIIQSFIVLVFLFAVMIGIVVGIYFARFSLQQNGVNSTSSQFIASSLNSLQILAMNSISTRVALILNSRENHRTNTNHEDALIVKIFVFQFVNSYSSFFYLAFLAKLNNDCSGNFCITTLAINLGVVFGTRTVSNFFSQVMIPYIKYRILSRSFMRAFNGQIVRPEHEYLLDDYDTLKESISHYSYLAIQFGYMTLFVTGLPLAVTAGLITTIIETKAYSWRLVNLYRRPYPDSSQDIGIWVSVFTLLANISVITNAALSVFTTTVFDDVSYTEKTISFLVIQYSLFTIQFLLMKIIPDVSVKVEIQKKRCEFIVSKLIDKVEDSSISKTFTQTSTRFDLHVQDYPNRDKYCIGSGITFLRDKFYKAIGLR